MRLCGECQTSCRWSSSRRYRSLCTAIIVAAANRRLASLMVPRSAVRSGHTSSAATDGVAARKSATRSASVVSVSWPTALTTGIAEAKIARATLSSLNTASSSADPPPRARMITSIAVWSSAAGRQLAARSFYPMTMPLTVGPGTISVAITLGAQTPRNASGYAIHIAASTLGALALAAAIYLLYRYAERLTRFLGAAGTQVLLRLSAFTLLCIGVQIVWNGVFALVGTIPTFRAR